MKYPILTVTFNPAIDKTAQVEKLQPGSLHRLRNVRKDAGGKGINVAKTIHAFHAQALCTGFLAGASGEFIYKELQQRQIPSDFIWVEGENRTNLKILDDHMTLTELNEEGPTLTKQHQKEVMDIVIKHSDINSYVVLSGNVAKGVEPNIYRIMIEELKKHGIKVVFDADGELFSEGIKARPYIIKPNKYELAMYFHMPLDSSCEQIMQKAKTLLHKDTKLIVVSMGGEGSIFISEEGVYQANAIKVTPHSSVGAGDAMVAAITYAMQQNYTVEDVIRFAVACSAGAVMSEGTNPADFETIQALKEEVVIQKIE